jgi:hypothetical protein
MLAGKMAGHLVPERRNRINRQKAGKARDAPGLQPEKQDSN